jgi:hypothetical protein
MKPMLKGPGAKRLKVKWDELLSSFAFNSNLRRYNAVPAGQLVGARGHGPHPLVGRSSFLVSKPVLKAPYGVCNQRLKP